MKTLSIIEEKFLFPFSRYLSFILIVFLIIALIIGFIFLLTFDDANSKYFVSLAEIKHVLYPKVQSEESISTIFIPANVRTFFTGENKNVLNLWLDSLKDNNTKQDFVDNLSQIISQANKENHNLVDVINKYKDIKFKKLQEDAFGVDKMMKSATKAFIGVSLFLLLLSLLLVILIILIVSIEKNIRTRQQG